MRIRLNGISAFKDLDGKWNQVEGKIYNAASDYEINDYEIIDENSPIGKLHLQAISTDEHIFNHFKKINEIIDAINKIQEKMK